MSKLRLGVHQLPAAEVVLVQTLMRLYAHGENCQWSFASAPPYDALLTASDTEVTDGMARLVLRLAEGKGAEAPGTVRRPIRADRLQQCLDEAAQQLQAMPAPPAPAPAADEREAPVQRFKLKHWPPVALLQDDPLRIRMATLLSRHAMSVEELATASKQPTLSCRRFLQDLHANGLTDGPPPPRGQESDARHSERGLLTGLRQKLGF